MCVISIRASLSATSVASISISVLTNSEERTEYKMTKEQNREKESRRERVRVGLHLPLSPLEGGSWAAGGGIIGFLGASADFDCNAFFCARRRDRFKQYSSDKVSTVLLTI